MRKNLPVTATETTMRPDQYLISKTNKKGVITYANPAFVEVSGFTYEDLIRQPHNMVRHPDMPPQAFEDLWATLKAGKPWLGMVKNRRKDGGYYWVLANATPIVTHGELVGYASVRVKPSEAQIREAEHFYADVNRGQSGGYAIRHGQKAPTGWRRWLAATAIPWRAGLRPSMFRLMLGFLLLLAVALHAAGMPDAALLPQHWLMPAVIVCATLLCLYGWRIGKQSLQSLEEVSAIARQISAGNLAVDIDTEKRDETRMLFFYLDLMRKSLMDIASNVRTGVCATVSSAESLNNSNDQLAQRTEEQSASLQQTAASMEQFSATVQQNADNAQLASQLADSSMLTAGRGGEAVTSVVQTIQGIHESSRKMADIVTLIDGIAFQTNILALNAAVESARAGDAGRGFAVVAGEVRNLAQRSGAAAREIRELIDDSITRIAQGADQARHAGTTMQEIVQSVSHTTQVMNQISAASAEQADGLAQIRNAIQQMDHATQENANLVQELGHTAQHLFADGIRLRQTIEVLSLGTVQADEPVPQAVPARRPAPRPERARRTRAAPPALSLSA